MTLKDKRKLGIPEDYWYDEINVDLAVKELKEKMKVEGHKRLLGLYEQGKIIDEVFG